MEEQQKEVEEKLKVQVASLLKDVGELYNGQETLGEHIEKMQDDEAGRLARLEVLESGVPGLKSQVVEMDERVKSLEEETKSIHGGLVSLQLPGEQVDGEVEDGLVHPPRHRAELTNQNTEFSNTLPWRRVFFATFRLISSPFLAFNTPRRSPN